MFTLQGMVYHYTNAFGNHWSYDSYYSSYNCRLDFGAAISVNNNETELMIGEASQILFGVDNGFVNFYTKTSNGWSATQRLQGRVNSLSFGKLFGTGIAMCGNVAFIGSPFDGISAYYQGNKRH